MRALRALHLLLSVLRAAAYRPLSDASLRALPSAGSDYDIHTGALLAPILRIRKPGTPEIEQVRDHFVSFFKSHLPQWNIAFQNSTQPTALGRDIKFVNLIMTRDPPWASPANVDRLTFAAHYDSKITPEGFIGAIDSAVPCAVMMHLARSLDAALTKKWADMQARKDPMLNWEKGVQMIFFDGEEAFINWSDEDSLYGSRALAAEMEAAVHPALSMFKNDLDSIELFVLLDLLGSANPNVPSYFITTHWAYESMATVESRLRKLKLLKTSPRNMEGQQMFLVDHKMCTVNGCDEDDFARRGSIADDHLPFMARGVQILHMIPSPFPDVWHEITDDGAHLDLPTVEDWSTIFTGFAAEYLELEGHIPPSIQHKRDSLEHSDWQGSPQRDELSPIAIDTNK